MGVFGREERVFWPFLRSGAPFLLFCAFFRAAFLRGGAAWRGRRFWGRFWAEQWRDGVHRGLFGADFFHFLVQKTRSCALGDVFGAGKWVFGPPGGAGLGWAQGGGIVMHSTCLAGCQIFSSLARFSFLPAHALRCSLLLCAPHYYTHAQRSPAARLFALARLRLARSCTNQTTDKSQRIASKACSAAYNPAFAPKVVCNAVSRRHLLHPHSSQAAPRPFRRNALSTSANVSPGNPVSQTTNVTSQLLSSVDSGILEAFSHYPTRGSLSA